VKRAVFGLMERVRKAIESASGARALSPYRAVLKGDIALRGIPGHDSTASTLAQHAKPALHARPVVAARVGAAWAGMVGGRLALALLLAAAVLLPVRSALATPQVFLVQNSGWMEPFYTDPASPFKPLVTELVAHAVRPGDPVVLAAFNQSLPGAPSPRALLSRTADADGLRGPVRTALAALAPAHKPGATTLADTDLGEAVQAALGTALAGRPGIVWLVTNNRNSPNNDQATARRNREFYQLIHQGRGIAKALAWPLRMPVKGKVYQANGLMVYAFAVGAQGQQALDDLLASNRLSRLITERPARLKPLDRETVRLVPRSVEEVPGVNFHSAPNGLLRADIEPGATAPAARVTWHLENTIYPYTIKSASISARSRLGSEARAIQLGSTAVRQLAPGERMPLSSTMQLPVAQVPGRWSLEALGSAGSSYLMPGQIEITLTGQELELSEAFRARMADLFPGDPLPDIFTPPARIDGAVARLPLDVRVHYGSAPLIALIGGGALLLGGAVAGAMLHGRPRKAIVQVDGERRTMLGRPGNVQPIYDSAGQRVAQLKTTLFGHQLVDVVQGAHVKLGG
jgi:hypothetical protein